MKIILWIVVIIGVITLLGVFAALYWVGGEIDKHIKKND